MDQLYALKPEEQKELFKKYYETKDPELKKILIESNVRLVMHVAKKYTPSTCFDHDDIVSVGILGLIRAVETYNPSKETEFSVYAITCIKNSIKMEFRNLKKHRNVISLETEFGTTHKDTGLKFSEIIKSDYDVEEKGEASFLTSQVQEKIDNLPERKKFILNESFGLKSGVPKRDFEIAKEMGLSRPYISRLRNSGIDEVKKAFDEKAKDEKGK